MKSKTFRIWSLSVVPSASECFIFGDITRIYTSAKRAESSTCRCQVYLEKGKNEYCPRSWSPMILTGNIVFTTHAITRSHDSWLDTDWSLYVTVCEGKWPYPLAVFSWRASVATSIHHLHSSKIWAMIQQISSLGVRNRRMTFGKISHFR